MGLQEAAVGRLKGRDKGEVPKNPCGDPYHKHHNPIVKEIELLHKGGGGILQVKFHPLLPKSSVRDTVITSKY